VSVSVSEQLHARCCALQKTWAKFDRGEKAERRQSGLVKFWNDDVRSDVKVWLDVEHTGNSTELESSGSESLAMALGEGKFDERGARNRHGQAANQPSKRFHRVYYRTASSRCRSKAALNGVILSSASWIDQKIASKKLKKKICERFSGNQLGRV
jgi:hypothetical protein